MVRLKRRWLLVRVDSGKSKEDDFPTRNELSRAIRENLLDCFGDASVGTANETRGMPRFEKKNQKNTRVLG